MCNKLKPDFLILNLSLLQPVFSLLDHEAVDPEFLFSFFYFLHKNFDLTAAGKANFPC